MPSKKSMDQVVTWLKSKTKDPNTLESINAELCLNVIADLKRQLGQKGFIINSLKTTLHEEDECPYEDLVPAMRFYAKEGD